MYRQFTTEERLYLSKYGFSVQDNSIAEKRIHAIDGWFDFSLLLFYNTDTLGVFTIEFHDVVHERIMRIEKSMLHNENVQDFMKKMFMGLEITVSRSLKSRFLRLLKQTKGKRELIDEYGTVSYAEYDELVINKKQQNTT